MKKARAPTSDLRPVRGTLMIAFQNNLKYNFGFDVTITKRLRSTRGCVLSYMITSLTVHALSFSAGDTLRSGLCTPRREAGPDAWLRRHRR